VGAGGQVLAALQPEVEKFSSPPPATNHPLPHSNRKQSLKEVGVAATVHGILRVLPPVQHTPYSTWGLWVRRPERWWVLMKYRRGFAFQLQKTQQLHYESSVSAGKSAVKINVGTCLYTQKMSDYFLICTTAQWLYVRQLSRNLQSFHCKDKVIEVPPLKSKETRRGLVVEHCQSELIWKWRQVACCECECWSHKSGGSIHRENKGRGKHKKVHNNRGSLLTLVGTLNVIIFSWHNKKACESCSLRDAPCKSLLQKGNYFPGPSVINLNSLVSQIVAHNKYGAARDAYLLWHPILAKTFFSLIFSLFMSRWRSWKRQLY